MSLITSGAVTDEVRRAYVPKVEHVRSTFVAQNSLASLQALAAPNALGGWPRLVPVTVTPSLIHRKVWAYIWSISATFTIDCDLVALRNGAEVYRQKLMQYNTAVVNNRWYSGLLATNSTVGAIGEQYFRFIAGSTLYAFSPWRYNLACDTFYIEAVSITGAAAAFDLECIVQSQAGI